MFFSTIPFYQTCNLSLLWGSLLLCLLATVGGSLLRRFRRADMLPPISIYGGTSFPTKWDEIGTYSFLLLIFMAYSAVALVQPRMSDAPPQLTFSSTITNVVIYIPMLARFYNLPRAAATKHARMSNIFLMGVLAVGGVFICSLVYELSGLFEAITTYFNCPKIQAPVKIFLEGDMWSKIWLGISAVVIAPICEECCFRGFLYNCIRKHTHAVIAAVLSSLLFAAVHLSLAQFLPLLLFALAQCYIYERSKTLVAPMVTHALFNALALISTLIIPQPI